MVLIIQMACKPLLYVASRQSILNCSYFYWSNKGTCVSRTIGSDAKSKFHITLPKRISQQGEHENQPSPLTINDDVFGVSPAITIANSFYRTTDGKSMGLNRAHKVSLTTHLFTWSTAARCHVVTFYIYGWTGSLAP